MPWDEVSRCFTGVALELRPRADFVREKRTGKEAARSYLRELFAERALFTRVVVVSLIMRLFALVLPLVTGLIIDWVVPRSALSMLWIVLGSVVGIIGVQAVCTIMRAQLLLALRTNLDGKITLGFLDRRDRHARVAARQARHLSPTRRGRGRAGPPEPFEQGDTPCARCCSVSR